MDYYTNNPDETGIEYLDNFYEQSFSYYFSDAQKKKRRNRLINKILRLLSIYTILILLSIFYFDVNTKALTGIIVALPLAMGIIKKFFPFSKNSDKEDERDFELLTKYRYNINRKQIAPERPCCLTQQGAFAPKKSNKKSIIFFIIVLIIFMVLGLAIPFNIYGVPEHNLWAYVFVLFLAASGFTGILLPNIIKLCVASIKYKEKVYAVCIENSRPNYSSMLRPVFYAKCKNGHNYLLFNDKAARNNIDTDVGDIIRLSVDSNNPFNYIRKRDLYILIFCGLIYTAVSMGLYILFNIYKL